MPIVVIHCFEIDNINEQQGIKPAGTLATVLLGFQPFQKFHAVRQASQHILACIFPLPPQLDQNPANHREYHATWKRVQSERSQRKVRPGDGRLGSAPNKRQRYSDKSRGLRIVTAISTNRSQASRLDDWQAEEYIQGNVAPQFGGKID